MTIQVTSEDIQSNGKHATDNPISRALRRITGQTWIIVEGSMAYLLTAPHRAVSLPYHVFTRWREYQALGTMEPFKFEFATETHVLQDYRRGDRRQDDRRQTERRVNERRSSSDRRRMLRPAAPAPV